MTVILDAAVVFWVKLDIFTRIYVFEEGNQTLFKYK